MNTKDVKNFISEYEYVEGVRSRISWDLNKLFKLLNEMNKQINILSKMHVLLPKIKEEEAQARYYNQMIGRDVPIYAINTASKDEYNHLYYRYFPKGVIGEFEEKFIEIAKILIRFTEDVSLETDRGMYIEDVKDCNEFVSSLSNDQLNIYITDTISGDQLRQKVSNMTAVVENNKKTFEPFALFFWDDIYRTFQYEHLKGQTTMVHEAIKKLLYKDVDFLPKLKANIFLLIALMKKSKCLKIIGSPYKLELDYEKLSDLEEEKDELTVRFDHVDNNIKNLKALIDSSNLEKDDTLRR